MHKLAGGFLIAMLGSGMASHAHAASNTVLAVSANNGFCMTMDNATAPGTFARQTTCDGTDTQLWNTQVVAFNASASADAIGGGEQATVRLVNVKSGLCLDNLTGANAGVVQNTCNGSSSQQWTIGSAGVNTKSDDPASWMAPRQIRTQNGYCLDGSLNPSVQTPYRNVNVSQCSVNGNYIAFNQAWYVAL